MCAQHALRAAARQGGAAARVTRPAWALRWAQLKSGPCPPSACLPRRRPSTAWRAPSWRLRNPVQERAMDFWAQRGAREGGVACVQEKYP